MCQHAPWLPWFTREAVRFWYSLQAQWHRWRMWQHPRSSGEFKRRFHLAIKFNRLSKE